MGDMPGAANPTETERPERRGLALVFGVFAALGVVAYVFDPWVGSRGFVYFAIVAASAAAVVVGVRRWRPRSVMPWGFAAAGMACAALGGWGLTGPKQNPTPMSIRLGLAGALFVAGYVLMIVGAMLLTRVKRPGRDVDAFLDGAIFGIGALIVAWVTLLGPEVRDGASLNAMLVNGSFVVADLIVLAVIGRIAATPHLGRNRSFQLIVIGLLAGLVADVTFLVRGARGGLEAGFVGAGWLVAFVCFGTAALLPDIRELSEPVAHPARKMHPARVGLFAIVALVPGVVFLVADFTERDRKVVAAASFVLAALVVARLTGLIRSRERELSARDLLERRLSFNATHDPLTGLGNRGWFMERLDHALAVGERTGTAVGTLFVNLDHFKDINDGFGHAAGDRALVECGRRISSTIRESDSVARFGGDEFIIAVEAVETIDDVLDAAGRVARAVRGPIDIDGNEVAVTATIGVASTLERGFDAEELLRDADAALNDGKHRGRDTVVVCDQDLRDRLEGRLRVEAELRGAAERGEFVLLYQPEVEIATGELFGVEALIRWQHPTRGLLGPDQFLPVAEHAGLINEIGSWVIDEACRQSAIWRGELGAERTPVISFNVSPAQLVRDDVAEEIIAGMARHGVDAGSIRVEVTETAVLADTAATANALWAIRAVGVEIAVDDFGTGYFSLSDLVRYPIDIIKIDRTFVRGLGSGGTEEAIVISTLRLAKTLGRRVIAEGVETQEQADHLRHLGCDAIQGYLYAWPLPASQIGVFQALMHVRV